jgi:hypothetical protein
VNKLLATLNRLAKTLNDAMTARARSQLASFLAHEERGGPTP